MDTTARLLDVVALLIDLPEQGLRRGQVGTVVEVLNGAFEVEFADDEGRAYAELALPPEQLLVLHHRPELTDSDRSDRDRIRSSGLAAIPVVVLAAHALEADRTRAEEAGRDGCHTKPIKWPSLQALMVRLHGERRASDGNAENHSRHSSA